MQVWKWCAGTLAGLVILAGLLVYNLPSILIQYPELMGILSRLREPIGPTRDVAWEAGPATAAEPASSRAPNIVVILVDDLGWNDLTWNGGGVAQGTVPTPHIDSLARDGIQFTMGYAGNATCAPSRAAPGTGPLGPICRNA